MTCIVCFRCTIWSVNYVVMDGRETKIFIDNFHSLKAAQLIKCLSSLTALQMLATILSRTKPAIRIKARSFHLTFLVLSKY